MDGRLKKMSEIFQERGDTMQIYCAPGQTEDAYKGACDYLYATIISRLGDLGAKSSVVTEHDDRVIHVKGDKGFSFTHDDGTIGKFLQVSTEDKYMIIYEAADEELLTKTVEDMVDGIWSVVKDYIVDGKLWFLCTPKLWFTMRAGQVQFRSWCVVAE